MKYNTILFDWGGTLKGHGPIPAFVHKLIRDLFRSGYRLGIVSNSHRYGDARWLRRELGKLDWIQYFEVVIGSGGVLGNAGNGSSGCHKPDPMIYHKATDFLGVEPSSCVFLGDSFRCDVLGAQNVGMSSMYVDVKTDYSVELWLLLEDTPTDRPNTITTYSFLRSGVIQCYLRDLSEPLRIDDPILIGREEHQITGFSFDHNKDDILDTGGKGHQLIDISFA